MSSSSNNGRKRQAPSAPVYSPNETLNQMTAEAERRQQESSKVQKEAREIRAREMEKQRKEDEEREREEYITNGRSSNYIRNTLINGTTSTTNGISSSSKPSRFLSSTKSNDLNTVDTINGNEDNPKELKKKVTEMEEKYKKHAIYQTQLENDKQKLEFEVDNLKDLLEEYEELLVEIKRQYKHKCSELDQQKRDNKDLSTDFERLKEILKQRDKLIEDSGLILYTDDNEMNSSNDIKSVLPAALVAPETAKLLDNLVEGTIDDKLKKLLNDKIEYKEQLNKLKSDLEDEKIRSANLEKKLAHSNSRLNDSHDSSQSLQEMQRTYLKENNELKLKLQKIEHENNILKQEKTRIDAQLKNLVSEVGELDDKNNRLDKEKREVKKELNEARKKIDDLELKYEVLQRTLDRKRENKKPNDFSSAFRLQNLQTTPSNSSSNLVTSSSSTNNNTPSASPSPVPNEFISATNSNSNDNNVYFNYKKTILSSNTNILTTPATSTTTIENDEDSSMIDNVNNDKLRVLISENVPQQQQQQDQDPVECFEKENMIN